MIVDGSIVPAASTDMQEGRMIRFKWMFTSAKNYSE